MKKVLGFVCLLFLGACGGHTLDEKKLLVFFDADKKNIENDINKLTSIGVQQDIKVDTSSNISILKEDTLKYYSGIVFLDVQGSKLDYRQQTDIERYVQAGGGLVGVNTTLSPQYQWPWQAKMLQNTSSHQKDESLKVTPVSAGDTEEQYEESMFSFDGGQIALMPSLVNLSDDQLSHLLNFVIGDNALNYEKTRSEGVPENNRFTRIVLDDKMNEPMELDVLPDGKVIYIQRLGEVKLYDPATQSTKQIAKFEVNTEGNYEEGLLGVALDPKFSTNHRIYFFYSVPNPDSVQRLSRFYMAGDSLIMNSEKMILEVPVQRETCCHTGGSIQFGPDGLLYLSTGDNTSSKESNGYTPIDERPGRAPFDAQKSSGNTQDLRGKILRIKINADGSYSIPEGNLFAKDGKEGRPEIYVMGTRNPFRISIDWKNNWLYWGDVGPDVGKAGEQGPESYDEWNQARKPGYYGWPYFVANNKAYPDWDFTSDTPGPYFDPEHPVNNSPNNYGSKTLPPAQPATIWYPYGESAEWPNLGTGSRSAMAGPVYYADRYPYSDTKFPEYYDGKLFIYEWARSWIKIVSFDEDGHPVKIEPFMPDMPLSKPIDMEFGPDGSMYLLEYGANYFADNDEARLVKLEYAEGNRKPIAEINVAQKAGSVPFEVKFSALQSHDYDQQDVLSYAWKFTDDEVQSTDAETIFTFKEPGRYQVSLEVADNHGGSSLAQTEIVVGNAQPEIAIAIDGNQSFFYDNKRIGYQIVVKDKEDGSTTSQQISPAQVNINFDYLQQSKDLALLGASAKVSPFMKGRTLIDGSDCKSCHDMNKTSIGPSYQQIAERYHDQKNVVPTLANKIITGGNGNWGHSMMAAHPQHSTEETSEMVKYILSLADEGNQATAAMPLSGTFVLNKHDEADEAGTYFLSVSYTDKGANNMPALTTRKMITLRHPKVQAEDYEDFNKAERQRPNDSDFGFVRNLQDGSYIVFKDVDLTDITSLTYQVLASRSGGNIQLRLDSPEGKVVSQVAVPVFKQDQRNEEITASVTPVKGSHDLYFTFTNESKKEEHLFGIDWIYFHSNQQVNP